MILVILFWFLNIYPKCMYEGDLFSKFYALHKWSSDIAFLCSNLEIAFSKWKVIWVYFSYSNFPLVTESLYGKVI